MVHGAAAGPADIAGGPVDAVVSGLPSTVMPTADRNRTLDAVAAALAPSGRFTTFAVVWPSLPPAFVHLARAPRKHVSPSPMSAGL
ncbi:hypothetical protein AQJ23_04520 [Streptomyces antibioticus]|nr:hypothetical protein [Streptomyces antibioticus]KUN29997.1 hypothetical protein AQJ23_04520 [Streptomyces antibioticus]